jgi:hypothetical protein
MKKLQLNKQTIAQLDEPGKIYGGTDKANTYSAGNTWYTCGPPCCNCGIAPTQAGQCTA